MCCKTCPFAFTEESEIVQNYGCLPTPKHIFDMKDDVNANWMCHSNPRKICDGLKEYRDVSTGHPAYWSSASLPNEGEMPEDAIVDYVRK